MGGKSGTTTQSVKIPPEVLARYNAVNAQAQSVAATPFQQYSTNPNDFVAPLNQQQYAGIGGINQAANMAQPSYAAATQGTYGAAQGFDPSNYQAGVQAYMNPYLQNAMGSTAAQMQNVNQQQQNQLMGNAIQQGAFGGDRSGVAKASLINQQNLAMGQTLGQMANQGYQQSAQNYMQGLAQQGQLYNQLGALGGAAQQSALQGAQAQLGAGTLEQQTQQAGQTALYNQFLQQQAYPFQVAQFLANIAMGTGGLSGSTTTTTQPMPFFSDRRLKKNVERIGQTDEGLPIHKFEYKGDPKGQKHIGLMADEVEQIHPEAVGTHKSGYKVVDYDKATSEGGAVTPSRAGLGFAEGGMPKALSDVVAMQNAMPVQGGGINEGLAAAARAIAPSPNIPESVYRTPSYNPFADPKYQPDFSNTSAGLAVGSIPTSDNDRKRDNDRSDNPFSSNNMSTDPNGMVYDSSGRMTGYYDPTQYRADGGRTGYQTAGAVMQNPAFDPYNINNILNRHMDMYNRMERGHHVPAGRSLSGGMSKYGRVPEANLPVRSSVMQAGSAPSLPDSILKQAVEAGSDFTDTFKTGRDIYNYFNKSAGGLVGAGDRNGYATDGTVDPTEDIYKKEDTSSTKRNIPTSREKLSLAQPAKPPTPTSQTGLGIGDLLSIGKFAMGLPFFNHGGRAGYDNGGGIDFSKFSETVRPVAEEFVKTFPQFPITSGHRTPEHNTKVGGAEGSQHLHGGAFDFGTGKASDQEVESAIKWLQSKGLKGYGYYPKTRSVHADEGDERYWGPDFTSKSLGQTPAWFQRIAGLQPAEYDERASLSSEKAVPSGGEVVRASGSAPTQGTPQRGVGVDTDRTTNTDLLLSILGGVGTMASSNSPFLGGAILQGLGGGAKTYAGLRGQQSEMALRETEMLKNTMGLLNDRFKPLANGGFYDLWTGQNVSADQRASMGVQMGLPPSFFGGSETSGGLAPSAPTEKDGFPIPQGATSTGGLNVPAPAKTATTPQAGLTVPQKPSVAEPVPAAAPAQEAGLVPPAAEPATTTVPPVATTTTTAETGAPPVDEAQKVYQDKVNAVLRQVDQYPEVKKYRDSLAQNEIKIKALEDELKSYPAIDTFQEQRANITTLLQAEKSMYASNLQSYRDLRNQFAEPLLAPIKQEQSELAKFTPPVVSARTSSEAATAQTTKDVEIANAGAKYLENLPAIQETQKTLINSYAQMDMNRLAELKADFIGYIKEVPMLDRLLKTVGVDVDSQGFQSLQDAAKKAAVSQAFAQLASSGGATDQRLGAILDTVANTTMGAGAKYTVITKNIAEQNRQADLMSAFINRENKSLSYPQFVDQWARNPDNKLSKYIQKAVNETPFFDGMTVKDYQNLGYRKQTQPTGELPPNLERMKNNLSKNADGTKYKNNSTGIIYDTNGLIIEDPRSGNQ